MVIGGINNNYNYLPIIRKDKVKPITKNEESKELSNDLSQNKK